jgi:hypothetical protein
MLRAALYGRALGCSVVNEINVLTVVWFCTLVVMVRLGMIGARLIRKLDVNRRLFDAHLAEHNEHLAMHQNHELRHGDDDANIAVVVDQVGEFQEFILRHGTVHAVHRAHHKLGAWKSDGVK